MKLNLHELRMYVDDDYRENVLKNIDGKEFLRELELQNTEDAYSKPETKRKVFKEQNINKEVTNGS